MFKIKKQLLNDQEFNNALAKLANTQFPGHAPIEGSYNISRILRRIKKAQQEMTLPFNNMIKKYCMLDEKGEIIPMMESENKDKPIPGTYRFENAEIAEKFNAEAKNFMNQEVSLESNKINIKDLQGVDVTPGQLEILSDIIDTGPKSDIKVVTAINRQNVR